MRNGPAGIIAAAAAAVALAGCGGGLGLTGKSEEPAAEAVSLERENTPQNRLLQVSATAARASYCAFGMDRAKLKADYLAYERNQGASPDMIAKFDSLYDSSYNLFYKKVRENPESCSKEQIEEIRPDINRHLAGDYTPSRRKPQATEQAEVRSPGSRRDQVDITSDGIDNPIWEGKDRLD